MFPFCAYWTAGHFPVLRVMISADFPTLTINGNLFKKKSEFVQSACGGQSGADTLIHHVFVPKNFDPHPESGAWIRSRPLGRDERAAWNADARREKFSVPLWSCYLKRQLKLQSLRCKLKNCAKRRPVLSRFPWADWRAVRFFEQTLFFWPKSSRQIGNKIEPLKNNNLYLRSSKLLIEFFVMTTWLPKAKQIDQLSFSLASITYWSKVCKRWAIADSQNLSLNPLVSERRLVNKRASQNQDRSNDGPTVVLQEV